MAAAYHRPRVDPGGTRMRSDLLVAQGELSLGSAQEESDHLRETAEEV